MFQTVKGFLHTEGRHFVNEEGNEVILRGMGVGNWLNPEGFLFGGAGFGGIAGRFARSSAFDRGRTMDLFVAELAGKKYQKEFWDRWVANYLAEGDIAAMKRQGFNSIRLPLNARFLLEEEPGIHFNEDQFAMLDGYLDLCEKHGLYVIMDLHAATAGQSTVSCDDGVDNQPHLFIDEESAERTILLWKEMARRWKDRWIIAGFDLLNEPIALPMFDYLIPDLKAFYDTLVREIRSVDKNHILFIQGHRFAGRVEIFDHNYDPYCNNWAIDTHLYESLPDIGVFGPMLERSAALNVPIWMGETGGSSVGDSAIGNQWMTVTYEMCMEYHISYNIWVAKAVDTADAASTFTFHVPEGWDQIVDYCEKGGPKPSYEKAIRVFDAMLEAIRVENCRERTDRVIHALRRPGSVVPASGYDTDMPFSGKWPYSLYCGYRREDRMHLATEPGYMPMDGFIRTPGPQKYCDWPHILLILDEGDCASYSVREAEAPVPVRLLARADGDNEICVTCGEDVLFRGSVPVGSDLSEVPVGSLPAGERSTVTVTCVRGKVTLKEVRF